MSSSWQSSIRISETLVSRPDGRKGRSLRRWNIEQWINIFYSPVKPCSSTISSLFEIREEELSRVNQPLQEGPLPGFCDFSCNISSFISLHLYIGGYSQQDFYTLCRGETLQRWILIFAFWLWRKPWLHDAQLLGTILYHQEERSIAS